MVSAYLCFPYCGSCCGPFLLCFSRPLLISFIADPYWGLPGCMSASHFSDIFSNECQARFQDFEMGGGGGGGGEFL